MFLIVALILAEYNIIYTQKLFTHLRFLFLSVSFENSYSRFDRSVYRNPRKKGNNKKWWWWFQELREERTKDIQRDFVRGEAAHK